MLIWARYTGPDTETEAAEGLGDWVVVTRVRASSMRIHRLTQMQWDEFRTMVDERLEITVTPCGVFKTRRMHKYNIAVMEPWCVAARISTPDDMHVNIDMLEPQIDCVRHALKFGYTVVFDMHGSARYTPRYEDMREPPAVARLIHSILTLEFF